MMFNTGYNRGSDKKKQEEPLSVTHRPAAHRKSVVQVLFPDRNSALSYYNDQFDLQVGDFVYVEGLLEGKRGRVTEVSYNFKIKRSDYKRVIALVDTTVHGQFHYSGSHLLAFDRNAIPSHKVATWFKAPADADDEVITGNDDTSFRLDDLKGMHITPAVAERGYDYYRDNHVVYISIDGTRGYAIVEGSEAYEVEFEYCSGEISHLTCSCFCSYNCKHEFAAMLQLKEILTQIEKNYAAEYEHANYFAAIFKSAFFFFAVDGHEAGSFTFECPR